MVEINGCTKEIVIVLGFIQERLGLVEGFREDTVRQERPLK